MIIETHHGIPFAIDENAKPRKPAKIADIIWRNGYDHEANAKAGDTAISYNDGPLLTQQDATDADINELVKRFGITDGSILPGAAGLAHDPRYYGDFTEAPEDLRDAFTKLQEGTERFLELPADIRLKFKNDPITFLEWIANPANRTEAEDMGLLIKPEPPVTPIPPEGNPPVVDNTKP